MNELPEKATGVLSQFATTSTSIDVFSDSVIESVKQGEVDPLLVYTQIKAFAKAAERILKEISPNVITAAEKYPGTKFEFMGNEIQKGSVFTSYDFKKCCDPIFEQRESMLNSAKNLLDERKEFLKLLKEPMTIVIEDTGEIVKIFPPEKTETPGIKLTIR